MRNRYKSDLNRLIVHPRRNQGSKKLRSPGALNGTFAAASGLPREPAPVPGLPIYLMENGSVHRMSPDLLTIEETIYSNIDATDFAFTDGKLLVIQTYSDFDTDAIFVDSATTVSTSFAAPNYDQRPYCGANSTDFTIYFADGAGFGIMETYSLAGTFQSSFDIALSDLDSTIYWPGGVPTNDQYVGFQGFVINSGDFAFAVADLDTGNRVLLQTMPSKYDGPAFLTGSRYYYFNTASTDLKANITITDMSFSVVGSWQLQYAGRYYTLCVTEQYGYAFRSDEDAQNPYSTVEIYDRVGDTFTFLNEINLITEHGFGRVDTAMPDMKAMLATNA